MQDDIWKLQVAFSLYNNILICGDFNARVGRVVGKLKCAQYIESDDNTCNPRGKVLGKHMSNLQYYKVNGNFGSNDFTFERGDTSSVIDYVFM